jgi:hypothetical protein
MHATEVRSAAKMGSAAKAHPSAAKMRRACCTHTATTKVCAAAAAHRMGSAAASTTKTTTTASSRRGVSSAREHGHYGNNGEALDVRHGTLGQPLRFQMRAIRSDKEITLARYESSSAPARVILASAVSLDWTTFSAV